MLDKTAQIISGYGFKIGSAKALKMVDKKNDRFKVASNRIGPTSPSVLII